VTRVSIHERIKMIRERFDLTQEEFGERISLSRPQITLMEAGKRQLSERTANDICRVFGVNQEWLIHGEGEMFKEKEAYIQYLVYHVLNADEKERDFLMTYFRLPEKKRALFADFFDKLLAKENNGP
jgi:transcriptional regulator with XRE-family HTH domain